MEPPLASAERGLHQEGGRDQCSPGWDTAARLTPSPRLGHRGLPRPLCPMGPSITQTVTVSESQTVTQNKDQGVAEASARQEGPCLPPTHRSG